MDNRLLNSGDSNAKISSRPRFNRVSAASYLQELPNGTYVPLETGPGPPGPPGQAATIDVGTTTTVAYPTPSAVVNVGTSSAAVLDFTLSRGPAATVSVGTTSTLAPGSACTVTNVGTQSAAVLNFGLSQGVAGPPGAGADVLVGSTTTLPPGTPCSVSNSGTAQNVILNFGLSQGLVGPSGSSATISVGTVNTLDPGDPATFVNSGTASAAVFDVGLPRGADGVPASISVGNVTALPPGSEPTVVNDGSSVAAVLAFGLVTGDTGAQGASGNDGAAATVAVGSVVPLAPGSTPTVVNVGTSSAAVFDFGLVSGADAVAPTIAVGTVTPLAPGSTPTVVNVGTPEAAVFDFGLVTGDQGPIGPIGPQGDPGAAATIAIGTVSAVAYGSAPSVVNVGTPEAAVLNWQLVTGPQGPAGSSSSVLEYQFQTATATPPTSGHIRIDNVNPSLANSMYVSHIDGNGVDQDYILQLVPPSATLVLQKKGNSAISYTYSVIVALALTGYVRYEMTFLSSSGVLANNDQVVLIIVNSAPPGEAATVDVGTVTQVPYPGPISVTNVGTTSAALLDFVLCSGPDGSPGADGAAATISVGTVTALPAGSTPTFVNSGTSSAAVFNVGLPVGATGAGGAAATLTIGSTTTLPPGSSATASNAGTSSAAILNLGIPSGVSGTAASIAVGSVSSLPPGSTPTVTNVGTSGAAVLNFGLTEGAVGATGPGATVAVGTVSTLAAGLPATVTNVGTPSAAVFNYGIPQGQTGSQGSAATIAVGTVTALAPGSTPTFVNVGTSSAAVFDVGLVSGAPGSGSSILINNSTSAVVYNLLFSNALTGTVASSLSMRSASLTYNPNTLALTNTGGTFTCTTVTANLTGTASTAATVTTSNTVSAGSKYLMFSGTVGANAVVNCTNTLGNQLLWSPSTTTLTIGDGTTGSGVLTTGSINCATLTGTASLATTITATQTAAAATRYLAFVPGSGAQSIQMNNVAATAIAVNPSTPSLTLGTGSGGSGVITAGSFVGALTGNASSATQVTCTATSVAAARYLVFTPSTSTSVSDLQISTVLATSISVNPSTPSLNVGIAGGSGVITAGSFVGALTGNASSATQVQTSRSAAAGTRYVTFSTTDNAIAGNSTIQTATLLTYNPGTELLSCSNLTVTGTLTGSVSTATSLSGGAGGSIPYQTTASVTTFLPISAVVGNVLRTTGTAPSWSTPGGFQTSFGGSVVAAGNILAYNVPVALVASVPLSSVLATPQNVFVMPVAGILVAASAYNSTGAATATGTVHVAGSATPIVTFAAGSFTSAGTKALTLSSTTATAAAGNTVEVRINVAATGTTLITLYWA